MFLYSYSEKMSLTYFGPYFISWGVRLFVNTQINNWLVLLFQTHACAVIIAGVCLFVTESFWNFAMSTTVILSYSVQNFKTIWLNKKSFGPTKFNEIWANKVITV